MKRGRAYLAVCFLGFVLTFKFLQVSFGDHRRWRHVKYVEMAPRNTWHHATLGKAAIPFKHAILKPLPSLYLRHLLQQIEKTTGLVGHLNTKFFVE